MIRFVTYNTQFCTGLDGRTDIDRIVSEIEGADVIALQEVDRHWARTGYLDQAEELAKRMPDYHWAYGPGLDVDAGYRDEHGRIIRRRRQFGNMVLARWPLLMVRNHLLPKLHLGGPMSLQRAALETVIELPDGPCRVVSVHLAHAADSERHLQIDRLLSILSSAPADGGAWSGSDCPSSWTLDGPPPPATRRCVVMGDFNMTPGSTEYLRLCGSIESESGRSSSYRWIVDMWTTDGRRPDEGPPTFVGVGGPKKLDYIFATGEIADAAVRTWVAEDACGSDHKPVWLEISAGEPSA